MARDGITMFEKFHGRDVDHVDEINMDTDPECLVLLGKAVAIEYECDKLNGGGDGQVATYRHKFGKGVKLMCSPDGKTLYIKGGRMYTNERGIVN